MNKPRAVEGWSEADIVDGFHHSLGVCFICELHLTQGCMRTAMVRQDLVPVHVYVRVCSTCAADPEIGERMDRVLLSGFDPDCVIEIPIAASNYDPTQVN